MKFATKQDYTDATELAWTELWQVVDNLTESQLTKRSKIRNGPARSAKDALAHLYVWHVLLLGWFRDGKDGTPNLPAAGFKWSQTRDLNQLKHDEYADVELAGIRRRLKLSHRRICKLVESLSESHLLQSGHFDWTGKNALMSYIAPNTVSHYRWAIKKIKALQKS